MLDFTNKMDLIKLAKTLAKHFPQEPQYVIKHVEVGIYTITSEFSKVTRPGVQLEWCSSGMN